MHPKTYLGYSAEDKTTPYASFFSATIAPVQPQIPEALNRSPFPAAALAPLEQVTALAGEGYQQVECGYTLAQDGSIRIAVHTHMPRVYPPMWDWWFAWHGSRDNRYKLWHPKAHKAARWEDGRDDLKHYIGRNSLIEEYIGKSLEKASIRFLPPQSLGLPETTAQQTFICARLGYRDYPLDFGYLVHQVRVVEGGAEMRSRFFLGGPHVAIRGYGMPGRAVSAVLRSLVRLSEQRAKDLYLHCAEEMNHIAAFLPDLHQRFAS